MPENQVRGHFFPRRFGSAVLRPPVRRSALRVVRTPDSELGSGARRSLLRRSLPERRSLPFGSPGLPIQVVAELRSKPFASNAAFPAPLTEVKLSWGPRCCRIFLIAAFSGRPTSQRAPRSSVMLESGCWSLSLSSRSVCSPTLRAGAERTCRKSG